jgi:hypothetical protein
MAEDTKKGPKTQSYDLKPGAEITTIKDGESTTLVGAGGDKPTTVELTEDQAAAFSDKLAGLSDPEAANTANSQTIVVGAETAGRATIQEGGAAADVGAKAGSDNPENESNTDPVERPAPNQVASVKKAEDLAPKSGASSKAGGSEDGVGGKAAGSNASTANNSSGAKPGDGAKK